MPDVFTKAKRSEVMSRIRSRGNRDTELAMVHLLRACKISGWRRHVVLKFKVQYSRFSKSGSSGASPHRKNHAGFHLSEGTTGRVCGRLFLARLSQAHDVAGAPRGMVTT